MAEEIITYETLYETLRKEKYNTELQKLSEDFLKKVTNYLKEKQAILDSQKQKQSIFASKEIEKTERQIQNIKRILREMYERRENKIIQTAVFTVRSKKDQGINMLPEEEVLYKKIVEILSSSKDNILESILSAKLLQVEEPKIIKTQEKQITTKLIRFIHAVPKFIGDDLKTYGPFEEENIANLPSNIAQTIIKKGRAEEL